MSYNRMVNLTQEQRAAGVLACSAGNHAQGVALAAQHLGIKQTPAVWKQTPAATICMPTCTPAIKWKAVQRRGAEVLLDGRRGAEVLLDGNTFDDAKANCLRLQRESGRYSGGGLMAGILSYTKRIYGNKVRVFGAEDAAAMHASLKAGRIVSLSETFRIARAHCDEVLLVNNDEICAAIKDAFEDTRSILEAGAGRRGAARAE
eukprot:gene41845-21793_t